MSMLAMGAAALGSAALFNGNTAAQGWINNSARESLNKNITKTNLKLQKQYDLWTQQQDMAYEKWYQRYMYNLQANEYYDLAQRYGTNTASWAVEGLKKAGLNPILAGIDSNLSSSLGNASPASSSGRSSSHGVNGSAPSVSGSNPLKLTMLQDLQNSAKQGELIDAQTKLANTQADNAGKNEGLSGAFGAVANLLNQTGLKDSLKGLALSGQKWLERKLGQDTQGSSALSVSQPLKDAASSYDSQKHSSHSGVIPPIDDYSRALDKINAIGHERDSHLTPSERERERRLRNGRKYNLIFSR